MEQYFLLLYHWIMPDIVPLFHIEKFYNICLVYFICDLEALNIFNPVCEIFGIISDQIPIAVKECNFKR